jgi:acid phosphatase type 7
LACSAKLCWRARQTIAIEGFAEAPALDLYAPIVICGLELSRTPTPIITATPVPQPDPVLLAAGDIADCGSSGDEATAALLDTHAGTIITLGDNAYEDGSTNDFTNCFAPGWGQHKDRIRPAPGNHEYHTANASGYYTYFGNAVGDPAKGYYSYDLGKWHIIALNSNCSEVGGCGAGSPQEQWLRADLAANPATCTLAYWHHPRFSSGDHGNDTAMQPFWQALYEAGADLVLSGHDHHYERFSLQDPSGNADAAGIRTFIVGTGGRFLYNLGTIRANSEVRDNATFGILKLTLRDTSYQWQFLPIAGKTFSDSGSADCN